MVDVKEGCRDRLVELAVVVVIETVVMMVRILVAAAVEES